MVMPSFKEREALQKLESAVLWKLLRTDLIILDDRLMTCLSIRHEQRVNGHAVYIAALLRDRGTQLQLQTDSVVGGRSA